MAYFGGRYRQVSLLGAGGMGEVWLACDEELGDRPVAIKVLRSSMLASPEDMARFRREMRLAAKMQHPNIMTVYTTGADSGIPFLVMEYLKGSDLGKAPPNRDAGYIARIGRETCAALAYAHGLGVVHRDIKPGNLFLCDTGQVKVTDFGIARAVSGTKLSATGTLAGTLPYMAPEQWRGEPPAFSNDVWAVGCVLYELLCGALPRSYATPAQYVAAAVRGEPVPPLAVTAAVPAWLADAVMAMLRLDPRERPAAADCARLLAGPAARPAARHARLRGKRAKSPARRTAVIVAAGITALAATGTTAALLLSSSPALAASPGVGQPCAGGPPFSVPSSSSRALPFHGWYVDYSNGDVCIGQVMSTFPSSYHGKVQMRVTVQQQGTGKLLYEHSDDQLVNHQTAIFGVAVRKVLPAARVCVTWLQQGSSGSAYVPSAYGTTCGNVP